MSTDPANAAFGRLDATADESRPRDLAELAAALARIEALLAADDAEGAEGPQGSAAVERIADIAFVLHERDVEPSLCDALDAAVREIGAADALKQASMQRAREAAALLRALSRAVEEMAATVEVEPQPQPGAGVADMPPPSSSVQTVYESGDAEEAEEDELAAPTGLFDGDMPQDDAFALTVAALAASLPEAANAAPPESWQEAAEPVAPLETLPQSENAADEQSIEAFQAEQAIVSHSSDEAVSYEPVSDARSLAAEDEGFGVEASERAVFTEAFLNEPAAAPDWPAREESSGLQTAADAVADHHQGPPFVELGEGEPVEAASPVVTHDEAPAQDAQGVLHHDVEPEPVASHRAIDPDDDPGDLFEPDADAAQASIPFAALQLEASAAAAQPAAASALHLPLGAPAHVAPQPTVSDPLAPIRALSEEELIALFS